MGKGLRDQVWNTYIGIKNGVLKIHKEMEI